MSEQTLLNGNEDLSAQTYEFFNNQWKLYQKVMTNNYMGHRELYSILHEFLASYFQKPFSLLDLGCGDASFIAQALLHTTIVSYKGIDLSETALKIALDNMEFGAYEKSFIQGNLFEVVPELVQQKEDSFDTILASFTLHHLSLAQKDLIVGEIYRLLQGGGVFILIDIVRREAENREDYLRRYQEGIRQHWSLLTPQEIVMSEEHMCSSDFPETQATFYELARKHNFSRWDCLYRDPLDTTQLLCFYQ
ncbi:class I SAM-dependent methyltransferase [Microseira wollei]|uniref:Methyltransferase type 12 n=1 Tax=Microseira wollei NIES-4236 TaxID=2530354 RepID=A0AAV3XIJ9_9CYAN|nr:methyltransferase domain-containing protein [Microseira wollei]GET40556.1 methyltransferase type 12 [Microseira wollei NIES-4236]